MMKYLILICALGLTRPAAAQQNPIDQQTTVQFSGGFSRHLKHNLDGFSIEITGLKAVGKKWFLHYGGGFQQYWGIDTKFNNFVNALDGQSLQIIGTDALRFQTAGIQLQGGIGRNITRNLRFGLDVLARYQGTSVPQAYEVVDVSPTMGSGIQIIDPGYRIDQSPEQQITAGGSCYLLYSPKSNKWWLPGVKLIWQADLKKNTLLSTHLNWAFKF